MILTFGDSLTRGFGVENHYSYPRQLQIKSGIEVINAGVNGEFSAEGALRLPMLLRYRPELVILCHGANDILNNLSTIKLKENLLLMINLIEQSGAKVLLVGVPDFTLSHLRVHNLYTEIAQERGVLFEEKVLLEIQMRSSLKSDFVHPNAQGYEMMADAFKSVLKI